jgi:hypothetical protein
MQPNVEKLQKYAYLILAPCVALILELSAYSRRSKPPSRSGCPLLTQNLTANATVSPRGLATRRRMQSVGTKTRIN